DRDDVLVRADALPLAALRGVRSRRGRLLVVVRRAPRLLRGPPVPRQAVARAARRLRDRRRDRGRGRGRAPAQNTVLSSITITITITTRPTIAMPPTAMPIAASPIGAFGVVPSRNACSI